MAIAVSTNKDGNTSLYVNDSLSSVDVIQWHEVALIAGDECIFCYGILSGDSVGLTNYKNKDWRAENQKVSLKVHGGKERQGWDKETNGYKTVNTSNDELHLYHLLKKVSEDLPGQIFTGIISPWVNPYYWDFAQSKEDAHRAQKINDEIVSLQVCPSPCKLARVDIDKFITVLAVPKKSFSGGGYSKNESESDRLKARMEFVKIQIAQACEFTDLYDLSEQIVSTREENKDMSEIKVVENTIELTLELIAMVLGGK